METKNPEEITAKEREMMIGGLRLFSEVQAHFQKKYGFEFWKKPMEERKHWSAEQMMAIIAELSETWELTNKWWKKDAPDFDDKRVRPELIEEMVDMYHFLLSLMLTMEITPEEFVGTYLRKMGVNIDRQENDYSY